MSAFDKYIDDLVNERDTEDGFPKNETSWEELFDFGKLRIDEIVVLKRELARLRRVEAEYQFLSTSVQRLAREMNSDAKLLNSGFIDDRAVKASLMMCADELDELLANNSQERQEMEQK